MKSRRIGRRPNNGNRHRTVLVATTDADETKNQNAQHSGPTAKIHPYPSRTSNELITEKKFHSNGWPEYTPPGPVWVGHSRPPLLMLILFLGFWLLGVVWRVDLKKGLRQSRQGAERKQNQKQSQRRRTRVSAPHTQTLCFALATSSRKPLPGPEPPASSFLPSRPGFV